MMVRCALLVLILSTQVANLAFGSPATTSKSVEIRLNGVIISNNSRAALINGKSARVGERIDGIKVLAIDDRTVRVLSGSEEHTLKIGAYARLVPSAAPVVQRKSAEIAPPGPIRRVKHGDTLSEIAEDYTTPSSTLEQVVLAIFDANQHAFKGDIDKLRADVELRIPPAFDNPPEPPGLLAHAFDGDVDKLSAGVEHKVSPTFDSPPQPQGLLAHAFDGDVDKLRHRVELKIPPTFDNPPQGLLAKEDRQYGPIANGETLSEIAVRLGNDGISMHRMMTALFDANPQAFGDSIDLLHEGAILRIPDLYAIDAEAALAANVY